jgi:hypothetical protein
VKSVGQIINGMTASRVKNKFSKVENISAQDGTNWYGLATKVRRIENATINKTAGTITVYLEGITAPQAITYTETATSMTFTFSDAFTTTISIS